MKIVAYFLFVAILAFSLNAQENITKVKVAFAYKIINFIEMPVKQGAFKICTVGDAEISKQMKLLYAEKKLFDRSIEIVELNKISYMYDCDLYYFSGDSISSFDFQKLVGSTAIIITENKNALTTKAIFYFYIENDKIHFDINNSLAQKMGVKINSRLLVLAKKVE